MGLVGRQQQLVDVEHFAAHFLHGAVDQVAGEHPIALIHQGGELGQAVLGGKEAIGLALDPRQGLGAEHGRLGRAAAIAGHQADAEHGYQGQQGQLLQASGDPGEQRRQRLGNHRKQDRSQDFTQG